MSDAFSQFSHLLQDDSIPLVGLRILYCLGPDGRPRYRYDWCGDALSIEMIGVLEIIKSEIVHRTLDQ